MPSRVTNEALPLTCAFAVLGSRRISVRLVTDLPEPDSPTSAVVLPGWMEKLTSATERTRPSSVGKLVLRLLTVRRGV